MGESEVLDYRKLAVFALIMSVGGMFVGGCLCGSDPLGTNGDVSASALSYAGTMSGATKTTSATDAQASDSDSGRKKLFDASQGQFGAGAVAWLLDLDGNRLKDRSGNEYPKFPINGEGGYSLEGLPVGVDIILAVDVDGDGVAEMETIINIPQDLGADTGTLAGVTTDPLSSIVLAKLRQIAAGHGISLRDIGISPSGLIHRIRDAYEHLFETTGIEEQVLMAQLASLSEEDLAALFDAVIPPSVRRAMQMAEGNIQLALATDVAGIVKAVSIILLQGGFMIADDPGGVDLSFLGSLPHVRSMTFDEFDAMMRSSTSGAAQDLPKPEPEVFEMPTLYLSELAEMDRNFANNSGEAAQRGGHGPMFSEHMLAKMAEFYLAGKTVSLQDLYRLMVDLEVGMGARLTYFKWNGLDQGGTDVFQTSDGTGIALNLSEFFQQLETMQLGNPDPALFEQKEAELRQMLQTFLANTAEPAFDRLFDGVLMDRVGSMDSFAALIRGKRTHLPFSRSGPATFYVVATADAWQDQTARPVTVNVETDDEGKITKVTYDPDGNGKFYVGFGMETATGMMAELISVRSGFPLHDKQGGWQSVDISDGTIFQAVGGQSFHAAFSETGVNWPGTPALSVPNHEYDTSLPPDPETNPPAYEIFVLSTEHGPNGTPVRVDYANSVATYSTAGRYYLQFDEMTESNGTFVLVGENGDFLTNPASSWDWADRVLVAATAVQGISLAPETFMFIYGKEAPNKGYDASGAPYYDDINGNGAPDAGEPLFDWREYLWDPTDWRSTWVEKYYRRADNNGFPDPQDIDWGSSTPKLTNGVVLVARNLRPRLNAFRFGRPNITINLLAAFSPPEFFNGTHALNGQTRVNPFTAIAFVNLAFDSIHNILGKVDWDGPTGPAPEHEELIEAWMFVMPIGDPLQLLANGFEQLAQ